MNFYLLDCGDHKYTRTYPETRAMIRTAIVLAKNEKLAAHIHPMWPAVYKWNGKVWTGKDASKIVHVYEGNWPSPQEVRVELIGVVTMTEQQLRRYEYAPVVCQNWMPPESRFDKDASAAILGLINKLPQKKASRP